MDVYFCPHCQRPTSHRKTKIPWKGNFKKIAVYLVCSECEIEGSMWLENEEEIK